MHEDILAAKLEKWKSAGTTLIARTATAEEFQGTIKWYDGAAISLCTKEGDIVLFRNSLAYIQAVH